MSSQLWAPWRIEYILGPKNQGGCIFCAYASHWPPGDAPGADHDRQDLVVHRGDLAYVALNRYPFAAGHLLVIPNRHCACPEDLSADEHDALFRLATRAGQRLRRAVKADGLNVGINLGASAGAGIAEHLHIHIVPRWPGDTNFMPVLADVRVMPQALEATWSHIKPYFDDLSPDHAS